MKMSNKVVELKGYRDGLHLIIDPKPSLKQAESAILKRLANIGDSLSGVQVNLDVGDRNLEDEELIRLQKLLDEQYKMEIKQVNSDSEQTLRLAEKLKMNVVPAVHQQQEEILMDGPQPYDGRPEITRLIRHTLRSGQRERFLEGNIVVMGNVNPGGKVIASGDVIVLGALRGLAHAGALGDSSAVIIALDLNPTQLRIGELITRPPTDDIKPDKSIPEIAEVEYDGIEVSPYNKVKR